MAATKSQNNLELTLKYNQTSQTVCVHQYTAFPLRLSSPFRFEGANSNRIYHYLINTSPGLFAGDRLNLLLKLAPNSSLYLTDQAATKVHPRIKQGTKASVNYHIIVDEYASFEFIPEPIILYSNAVLEQNMTIKLHDTAKLFLSEIILPGRLARNEYYNFNYYSNRLTILDWAEKILFIDAQRLTGTDNKFKNDNLFTSLPVLGNAIALLPEIDLELLTTQLKNSSLLNSINIEVATTILPSENGILIRAMSQKTSVLKKYFTYALNCTRAITNQSPLPYIAK